jgi:hypothetical protein
VLLKPTETQPRAAVPHWVFKMVPRFWLDC